MNALEAGANQVLRAIKEAEAASAWAFSALTVDEGGRVALLVTRDWETRVHTFSPRQAEWISSCLMTPAGGFTLRSFNEDGRIDVDITLEGAILSFGQDKPGGGREVRLPRSSSAAATWLKAARQARSNVQHAKDGAP